VGDTFIIHKTGYIINAEYQVYGKELMVTCESFRAVVQCMPQAGLLTK
jgi:hypothetical protein